jgi:hypothetical protein
MFLHAIGSGIVTAAVMALAGGVLPYIGRIGLTQDYI